MKRTTTIDPTWCPGCGNFAILGAINQALDKLKLEPHQITFVYDVGCSSNMADFVYAYGFHGLHGRALPAAAGIKLANFKLPVVAIIGDGGCYGEGLNHFVTLARGNHDILVISHNNYLYSLTTGQMSPTTSKARKTPSTPEGSIEEPFNPLASALINHATFVARGFAGDIPHLTNLVEQGINHQGFALLDILQPCVTYNKDLPYDWYRKNTYKLEDQNHDPKDKPAAFTKAFQTDKLPIGLFYQTQKPAYHEQVSNFSDTPLAQQDISNIDLSSLL
jgi:2-oxoglutarate ferredoxin oxidoreductase subunit beta